MKQDNVWQRGFRITTAEILYQTSEEPGTVQSFIWQDMDLAPNFPVLKKFLEVWEPGASFELHSVEVATLDDYHAENVRELCQSLSIH